MTRTVLTFRTTHELLTAEKRLKELRFQSACVRPTPTPPGLTDSVCGMALEILMPEAREQILAFLQQNGLEPQGVHELD